MLDVITKDPGHGGIFLSSTEKTPLFLVFYMPLLFVGLKDVSKYRPST